jgi:hypothetical protein
VNPISLPPPTAGIDELSATANLEPPFCQSLINFSPSKEGASLRYGDSKLYAFTRSSANIGMLTLLPYQDTSIFTYGYDVGTNRTKIYDAAAGTLAYTSASGIAVIYSESYFNKRLYVFSPYVDAPGFVYDGSTWGATGYTGSGFAPVGGSAYKSRHYMIQEGEAAYWYSEIDAITGAVTKVDLSNTMGEKSNLAIIAPFSLSDGNNAEELLAFVFQSGLVLFYAGSYPNSADWRRVGISRIGQPTAYNSFVRYQSDVLLMLDSGIVSLRDLFVKGSQQGSAFSINSRIQNTWSEIVRLVRGSSYATGFLPGGTAPRGVYDQKNNRIIILMPTRYNGSALAAGTFYFIFDTRRQSWSFHSSSTTTRNDIAIYKNQAITLGSGSSKFMLWKKEGATGFTDRAPNDDAEESFSFEYISPPVSTGRSYVQQCQGLDFFIKSDIHSRINYSLISDLGVQTQGPQVVANSSTAIVKQNVNIGIEGSFIQYKISGTTASGSETVGIHLYGVSFWQDVGSSPR